MQQMFHRQQQLNAQMVPPHPVPCTPYPAP